MFVFTQFYQNLPGILLSSASVKTIKPANCTEIDELFSATFVRRNPLNLCLFRDNMNRTTHTHGRRTLTIESFNAADF